MVRVVAITALLFTLAPAAVADAAQSRPQKLFEKRLLANRGVSAEVKNILRRGGFVDADIRFGDITADGKSDALVAVNQGGSADVVALYLYSSHGRRGDGAGGDDLRILWKNQRLYRARAGLRGTSDERPRGALIYRTPVYDPGDDLADPGAYKEVEIRWSAKRSRFDVSRSRTIDRVRGRHCSNTGDYCTEAVKAAGGVVYLELHSRSFEGRYTLCVTAPDGDNQCRFFTLRRSGDVFVSRVRWRANFPNKGGGRYAVVWKLGGQTLGPTLGFRRD